MAVPTIISASPAVIFTGGHYLALTGTNFRTAYPPPAESTGVLPKPPPTMAVTLGTSKAKNVRVLSSTTLTCYTPPLEPGAVTVTVQNLDANGVAIPGESASVTTLIRAQRADLAIDSDFNRLERALMRELRRQVIDNVMKTAAVDYDGTPGGVFDVPDMAKLPALAIQGPQVVDNRMYDMDVSLVTTDGAGTYTRRNTFKTVNLTYRFVFMDTHQARNMNVFTLMLNFLQNNPYIEILRAPGDLNRGSQQYEMAQVGEFTTFTGSSESDIRGFSGSLVIRGFMVEDVAGFVDQTVAERGGTVDNVIVEPPDLFEP
jgi:hypothetical protein